MKRFLLSLILLFLASLPSSAVTLCNNAYMNTSTTGTGTLTLTTAVSGGQSFLDCGITNGQVVRYRIFNGAAWEIGFGTYTTAGTTLSRTVLESSNADAAVSLSAGATVIITPLTQDMPSESTTIDSTLVPASDYFLVMEGGTTLERALIATQMASTTEALTGTATDRFMTPDSTAAIWEKGSNVASAGTTTLGEGYLFHITGTTTITDIDWTTAKDGRCAILIFDGILTLTHNATTLIIPGGANILTQAGDDAIVCQDSSDNVIVMNFQRRAWIAKPPVDVQTITATGAGTWTKPLGGQTMCSVEVWGAGGSGGKGAAAAAAAGGAGGSYVRRDFAMTSLASPTEAVSVGTGGAAQTTASTGGNVGGDTTFSSAANLVTAYGGGGGGGAGATGNGGGGGGGARTAGGSTATITGGASDAVVGTVGNLYAGPYGSPGGNGIATGNAVTPIPAFMGGGAGGGSSGDATGTNSQGGTSVWGGAGGGAGAEDVAPGFGAGAVSLYGGNGGQGNFDASNAGNGVQPGGGGGGSETGNSGSGGNGKVVVKCW